MVNVSYPKLPQPVQAHEKDSVTSPNLPESVPESPPQIYETPTSSPQVHETPTLSRPQRDRKPPSRFMYYSAGEPFSCSNVFTNFPPSAVIPPKPPWFWVPTPHPSFPMMLPQPPPINKTNDLILNLTPENVTQHSRIDNYMQRKLTTH